ncbi:MAG: sulfatase-like hydrolase/transferase, partial [Chloroflexota bacterium]|nr:sulfatase-like hydrolase/transferase [Chloroflexota bacterium]
MQTILVVSDTLRADHLGCHGYFRPTSPRIDRFAAEGVRFATHVSQAPYTLPSFTSLVTSQFGTTHQVVANPSGVNPNFPVAVDDTTPVLADVFRAAGPPVEIAAGRYVSGGTLTASFDNLVNFPNHPKWFVRGYEYHVSVTPGTQRMVGADVLHRRLFPWLEQHAGEDFFLFIHYWDVHSPYLAPAPFGERYPRQEVGREVPVHTAGGAPYVAGWGPVDEITPEARARIDAYDGGIAYFDHCFGELLDHLERLGIAQQAVIALTADHGESMAEHRVPFAHDELYDATVHVPLIIRAPEHASGRLQPGQVVQALSQAVDIGPTLLDLAGLPAPPAFQGRSLLPLLRGDVPHIHERAYSEWTRYLASRSLRTPRYKLIHKFTGGLALTRQPVRLVSWHELYDLRNDPDEAHDLAPELPEMVHRLDGELRDWVTSQLTGNQLDPLLRPELACWEPGGRAATPSGQRTGGALSLLPPERNP